MIEKSLYKVSYRVIETDEITNIRIVAMTMHEAIEYAESYRREEELGEIIAIEWQGSVLVKDEIYL